ncbi:MAG: PEP-CTERM sorting domain-containing protein [Planctomycetales bacterium]|nr:PEP-CTERM sorting domain-containing protein [Planctomycetales bacterium]
MRLSLILVFLVCTVGRADFVTPNVPGVSYNSIPFGAGVTTSRYQQVHDAGQFATPIQIDSLSFSPEDTGGLIGTFQFRLGVTSVAVGALSTDLDSNITGPITTVFSGSVAQPISASGHDSFSAQFPFTTPFVYDPSAGNLLIEMTMWNGGYVGQTYMMSYTTETPHASRAWETGGEGVFANGADNNALRIKLGTSTAVPEPSSILMLGCIAGCIGATTIWRRWKKKS